jgi:hypothetical protein
MACGLASRQIQARFGSACFGFAAAGLFGSGHQIAADVDVGAHG